MKLFLLCFSYNACGLLNYFYYHNFKLKKILMGPQCKLFLYYYMRRQPTFILCARYFKLNMNVALLYLIQTATQEWSLNIGNFNDK